MDATPHLERNDVLGFVGIRKVLHDKDCVHCDALNHTCVGLFLQ